MKKVLVLALAVLMALPMTTAFAASSSPVTLDLSDVMEDNYYFQPGKTYYIPIMYGNYQLDKEEANRYSRFRVTVENVADGGRKGASVDLAVIGNYRYVKFSSTTSSANKENQTYEIKLYSYDASDKEWTDPEVITVDVGYSDSVFCTDSHLTVENDSPVVEFGDDVTDCLITFPDGSKYAAMLVANSKKNQDEGTYRKINLHSTTSVPSVLSNKYGNYEFDYLSFSTSTVFQDKSLLRVYAPGMNYLYRVRNQDELIKIDYTRSGDYMVFNTKTLDSYVMSKVELPASPASSTGSSSAPIVSGGALDAAKAGTAADSAFAAGSATVRFTGVSNVSLEAMQAIAGKARAKGITSVAYFDTMNASNGVETRITAYPASVTKSFSAAARIDDAAVGTVRSLFNTWFRNKVAVVWLGQPGDYGTKVEVAARVNLSGMNTSNLVFYSYSTANNTYTYIAAPAYWIDGAGYLHFNTTMGNYIIISEGALASK